MKHTKVKVMSTNQAEWTSVVNHARKLGAVSSDGNYGYRQDKPSMVVDNNYIKYSSPTAKSSGVQPLKISVDEFLSYRSLHQIGTTFDQTECMNGMLKAVIATTPTISMEVEDVEVLVQNDVIFRTTGLDTLRNLGLDVTMVGDVPYILDMTNNTAEELTAEIVSAKAKEAIIAGDMDSVFALFATSCQLISSISYKKPAQEDV